ncbi:DUF805 domain-containing protein [Levilactobacillus fujinensis]|uniref:DUF805 domain-containing protein n=1 Tax=Levilactobacillus fujinensis TaxID=2486024 RepID=A0ABW1TCF8_9LACO|nr:DUF805 domain-containing protein [Levilactobacillus fujinensis]
MQPNTKKYHCEICGQEIVTLCPLCGERVSLRAETLNLQPRIIKSFKEAIRDCFVISGRMGRADFWWFYLAVAAMEISLVVFLRLTMRVPAFAIDLSVIKSLRALILITFSGLLAWLNVMTLTAVIRRIHDTGKSGHYLWVTLIPMIGPIMVVIRLVKPMKGQRNRYIRHNPRYFYKWVRWPALAAVTLMYVGLFNYLSVSHWTANHYVVSPIRSVDSPENRDEFRMSPHTDGFKLGSDDIRVVNQQSYKSARKDDSWSKATFKINYVTVYKVGSIYHDKAKADNEIDSKAGQKIAGIIKVHMGIHANQNIITYPAQGTLTTNTNQKIKADISDSDMFAGELNKGTRVEGNIYYLVPKLADVGDITSVRVKWKANYRTNNGTGPNDHKYYDTTIYLSR